MGTLGYPACMSLAQGNQSSGKMRLGEFSLNIARLAYISTSELS